MQFISLTCNRNLFLISKICALKHMVMILENWKLTTIEITTFNLSLGRMHNKTVTRSKFPSI